ncbi:MAG: 50S ribosomal protein L32 [Candidatus Falkowbacteria bacterium]
MVQMKRHTSSARNSRRSHHALDSKTLNKCPKCAKAVEPHKACAFCGTYRFVKTTEVKKATVK